MRQLRWLATTAVFLLYVSIAASAPATADPPREKVVDAPHGVQVRLLKGAFDEIEAMAEDYRSSGARMTGGAPVLLTFYNVLARFNDSDDHCGCNPGSTYSFDDKRQALERWLAAKPKSMTARIALALLWQNYAWVGRGRAYAPETSDEQWNDFYQRMARARDLLQPVDPDADPEVYVIEMNLATVDERPKERLLNLYERAIRAFPGISTFATFRFEFTLPRWFGEPGEAAAFAHSLPTAPGGEAGLIVYFDVAGKALTMEHEYDKLLEFSGVSYPALVRAFATRAAVYGVSKYDMNVMMYYALAARDFKSANMLYEKIGDDWERSIWGDKAHLDAALAWMRHYL